MKTQNTSIKLFLIATLLVFMSSCDTSDPDPGPPSIGGTIEVEGGRGTDVEVGISLRAEKGIKSLSVSVEGGAPQALTVNAGAVNQAVSFPFSIPANATVGTTYSMMFTMIDQEDESKEFDAMVIVGNLIDAPETYAFTREEESTVSFPQQTDILNQLTELQTYLGTADAGDLIVEQALLDMFANTGGNGGGNFSFSSDQQLDAKAFAADLTANLFEDFFAGAALASTAGNMGTTAEDGAAGLLTREVEGSTILVDESGRVLSQVIEKGLMGSVLYNEIYNTYLTDALIGDGIENVSLSLGTNYTEMENNIDQAFGYWGAPVDFSSDWPMDRTAEATFWSNYSNIIDGVSEDELNTNNSVMEAFIAARTAIVNNDPAERNAQRDSLYQQLDLVAAAVAVHFINEAISAVDAGNSGEQMYALSNAWGFVNALRYSPRKELTDAEITTIMGTDFGAGGNFWMATADGLNAAKTQLVTAYPDLTALQDDL